MTQEALKLALEALEANDKLINGSGTSGGLLYCMDAYYSDCFDADPIVKQIDEAVAAIKEALTQPEQKPVAKYSDIVSDGGLDPRNTIPPQRTEQNFCPRCGKRTKDIHTCTPPQENT